MSNIKKLIVAAGISAAAVGIVYKASQVATDILVREALDRREPKIMKRLKGKVTGNVLEKDEIKQAQEKGKDLIKCDTKTVNIIAYDGKMLTGHIRYAENQKRVIIAMHGWRSRWNLDFGAVADFWYDNGCTVLYVEQRGQGDSQGDYMGFGVVERFDCLSWACWADEHLCNGSPMYLVGISMGAATVLMASGFDNLPSSIHGIIADCGFSSPEAIWKHVAKNNLHFPYGINKRSIDRLCRDRINMSADSYSTIEAMKTNTKPILFIHGSDDGFVPVSMTLECYEACKAPKKLVVVNGADHGMSYIVDKDLYEKTVIEFWNEFDE